MKELNMTSIELIDVTHSNFFPNGLKCFYIKNIKKLNYN